jgi:pimeloyl-ACP methyl ester carboxylesterase
MFLRGRPLAGARPAVFVAAAAMVATGCAGSLPRPDEIARESGFERRVQHGADYGHVVFANARISAPGALHVYIEGDGTPYVARYGVAADPTPRHPLMLSLMALDPAPSIYVGRPCYLGLANDPPCTPRDWTLGRFSPRIVDSMARVIEQLREGRGTDTIELYGHSGGGALAVLLAARLGGVQRIVTIGGNLDVDAWTAYHGYAPLEGSLNPVRAGPLPATLLQQHYVGDRDTVVPPAMVEAAARRLGAPGAIVLHGVTHARGWERAWPSILAGGGGAVAMRRISGTRDAGRAHTNDRFAMTDQVRMPSEALVVVHLEVAAGEGLAQGSRHASCLRSSPKCDVRRRRAEGSLVVFTLAWQ